MITTKHTEGPLMSGTKSYDQIRRERDRSKQHAALHGLMREHDACRIDYAPRPDGVLDVSLYDDHYAATPILEASITAAGVVDVYERVA